MCCLINIHLVPELGGKEAAWLSTLFDAGGIFGAVLIGFLSDRLRSRSLTCVALLALAIPLVSECIEVNNVSSLGVVLEKLPSKTVQLSSKRIYVPS